MAAGHGVPVCAVEGCRRRATAYIVRGEVYIGPPSDPHHRGVCGFHLLAVMDSNKPVVPALGVVSDQRRSVLGP